MEIRRVEHLEGARTARGAAIVIDVLRAFTTAACAFDAGATEILLVETPEQALALRRRFPDAFLMGETDGFAIEGFDHGNSPAELPREKVRGRRVIQRTGSGTPAAVAASAGADRVFVASLSVATATARAVRSEPLVTIVASAGDLEGDDAVGDYIEGLLRGAPPPVDGILRRIRDSKAGRKISSGDYPQYPPADLDVCARLDAFPFAMGADRENDLLRVRAIR